MTIVVGTAKAGSVIREFSLPLVREIPAAPAPPRGGW
jgi:hypothetical protein